MYKTAGSVKALKSFTPRSADLRIHRDTMHAGEKKYKCKDCGKLFSQKGSLNRHMAQVITNYQAVLQCFQAEIYNVRLFVDNYFCVLFYILIPWCCQCLLLYVIWWNPPILTNNHLYCVAETSKYHRRYTFELYKRSY